LPLTGLALDGTFAGAAGGRTYPRAKAENALARYAGDT
jgi:hypothetical protein